MAKIEIYTWSTCPFCKRALALLDSKGMEYVNYDITGDNEAREKMIERTSGSKSVPQVFVDDKSYGGFDDINMMDINDELDAVLGV